MSSTLPLLYLYRGATSSFAAATFDVRGTRRTVKVALPTTLLATHENSVVDRASSSFKTRSASPTYNITYSFNDMRRRN